MQAVLCHQGELEPAEVPEPTPQSGQVLVQVLRCGVCGSDLHARHHCDPWGETMARSGYSGVMRSTEKVILGHEFCAEILDYGPDCSKRLPPGTRCVAAICVVVLSRSSSVAVWRSSAY